MPRLECAHCGVPIVFEETMVKENGSTYCCKNCAAVDEPSGLDNREKQSHEDAERQMEAMAHQGEPRPMRPEGRGRQFR